MDQVVFREEARHLQEVYEKILAELQKRERELEGYRREMMTTRRSIWEEGSHTWEYGDVDAAVEIKQSMDALKQESRMHQHAAGLVLKLERLKRSPYFGRIDFMEEGYGDTERIYIGITSFFDEKGDILIYDWRAPVSGIFYDYELGPAAYQCLDGTIRGRVSLKRQYRTVESSLLYLFDTGLKIDDELLQEILSKNVDEKMRNIVNTIQKEQNRIIRDEVHQLLMVQGAAGSGKTSIALHRIAYMLYKYREENMTAKNILIFSPNTVFNDYISHVLPELGEENMQQTTFFEYVEKMAGRGFQIEDSSLHMEYVLTAGKAERHSPRLSGIAYKTSMAFLGLLDQYAHYLEYESLPFTDIRHGEQVLIAKEEIQRLMYQDYAYLPLARRLRKIRDRLHYLIRPAWRQRRRELEEQLTANPDCKGKVKAYSRLFVYREFKAVREQIERMVAFDTYTAFSHLFTDDELPGRLAGASLPDNYPAICRDTMARLGNRQMGYEDISAYVYLKGILEGAPSMSHIRHVVVDEAQDYTPVQYGILKQLFPKTRMTLLGDFHQTIHPLKESFDYQQVSGILQPESQAVLQLSKSYRSTSDIVAFTRSILGNEYRIESIQRSGEKPWAIFGRDEEDLIAALINRIQDLKSEGMESIGVICKTAQTSQALYQKLRKRLQAVLVTRDDTNFHKGIVVIPVYLAKGLEFDAALVYQANALVYGLEQDRKLFYTACTRALHRLNLFYTGELSPLMNDIPSGVFLHKSIENHSII